MKLNDLIDLVKTVAAQAEAADIDAADVEVVVDGMGGGPVTGVEFLSATRTVYVTY
jgi:hypothetical protein